MANSRPLAILIAEADEVVRLVTADMLEDAGFQAIEVRTAVEALAVLEGPIPVSMLITGRGIVGDGVALAHLVHHRWPAVGIIVTSGAGSNLQDELPPGTRLLSKPYDFADLIHEVEAGLAHGQDEPSGAPVLPSGVPPHTGTEMGNGMGAVATPTTEPDKS
ncbi:response regulator [Methylobacterium radiotolerans]|uniref:Response regulator n=2 Tax=Methylobacteriaceae TaxID=119045 RepID=A0ABU7TVU1_9HYPH